MIVRERSPIRQAGFLRSDGSVMARSPFRLELATDDRGAPRGQTEGTMAAMTSRGRGERGFGVAGALDHRSTVEIGRGAEELRYRTFWVNDTPNGDGLAALAAVAAATETIRLGVGVIPLDRQPAERIAGRVRELGLPLARLTLGVGSGGAPGGPERVRHGVERLRELLGPEATLVVGALGPRMCRVAGETADGVLFNWLTPAAARESAALVTEAAVAGGRSRPRIDGYVRTSIGAAGRDVLRGEGARYGAIPAYAAHFARMGVEPLGTTVAAEEAAEVATGLAAFGGVLDETVVRAITADETVAAYRAVLVAAAPVDGGSEAAEGRGQAGGG
jgi:alkanesulfonate monooxygenase SsuD/methylene tetrahydromethanopterin reductase-like flavin-dependent oxidoreductase (luciferase family)